MQRAAQAITSNTESFDRATRDVTRNPTMPPESSGSRHAVRKIRNLSADIQCSHPDRILQSLLFWTHNSNRLYDTLCLPTGTFQPFQGHLASPMREPRSQGDQGWRTGSPFYCPKSNVTKMVQGHHCVELLCTVQLIRWKG